MSLPLRSLKAEATSGITLISGVTGVLAMFLMAALTNNQGLNPGGGNVLNVPLSLCYLLATLLGGLAALRTGRLKAQGVLDLAASTPRGRISILTIVGTAYVAWGAVGYACGAAVTALSIGVDGPWTPGMVLLPVQAVLLLLVFIVLGVSVGSRFPQVLVGAGLTIVGMLGLNVLDLAPDPVDRFSPIFAGVGYQYRMQPNTARVSGVVVVLMGIVILVVALGFFARPRVRVLAAAVAILLLTSGGVRVLTGSAEALVIRSGEPGECRSRAGVELCVWPGPGVQIDNKLAGLVKVRAVATRLGMREPTHFHEEGLRVAGDSAVIWVSGPLPKPTYGVGAAVEAMLPRACDHTASRQRLELVGLFYELVSPRNSETSAPYTTGAAVAHQSPSHRRAWVAPRAAALRACQ